MKTLSTWLAHALCALAAVPAFAGPVFSNPLTTTVLVEAAAVNGAVQPGISRTNTGSGPIADAASALFGTSTADSSASVDATGLHAAASVHNASIQGYGATSRSLASIVNPFFVVPKAGFSGSSATIRIEYHLGGALNDSSNCPSCFEFVQADLGVDGMSEQFHFLGVHSIGTANNPTGNVTGVGMGGILVGLVPVNSELYLRAGLYVSAACQSFVSAGCDASALFGGTLGYFGFSSDAVDIVWGLAPAAPGAPPHGVPEPMSATMLLLGLALLGWQRRSA